MVVGQVPENARQYNTRPFVARQQGEAPRRQHDRPYVHVPMHAHPKTQERIDHVQETTLELHGQVEQLTQLNAALLERIEKLERIVNPPAPTVKKARAKKVAA